MCSRQHAEWLSHIVSERLEFLIKAISVLHCCSCSGLKCGKMPLKAEVSRSESPMITADLTVMTHFTFISLHEDMQNTESRYFALPVPHAEVYSKLIMKLCFCFEKDSMVQKLRKIQKSVWLSVVKCMNIDKVVHTKKDKKHEYSIYRDKFTTEILNLKCCIYIFLQSFIQNINWCTNLFHFVSIPTGKKKKKLFLLR